MASLTISTPRNTRVTAARRLAKRAFRTRARRFLAEGPQAVREALAGVEGSTVVRELFATAEARARYPEFDAAAAARGVAVQEVTEPVLAALAQTVTPQGVVAVCDFVDVDVDALLAAAGSRQPRMLAVLAQVRDPGNAGTVIRCADAAGAAGVVVSEASVDVYNPKTVRSSAGSLFHLPVSVGVDLPSALAAIRTAGYVVLAADGGVPDAVDLDAADRSGLLTGPIAWLFGNEAWGLPGQLRALADHMVAVPIHGRAESLNLATAAAVCLYATATAQRRG